MAYAEGTDVPIEKSKAEVERMLLRAGASSFQSGWDDTLGLARIQCQLKGFFIRFDVRTPKREEFARDHHGHLRMSNDVTRRVEAEERRRWRALVLITKAKLELVSSNESTVEREFLADIMLPDRTTVAETLLPQIRQAYAVGTMPRLLPG